MNNTLPANIPVGMQNYVHSYFGPWAMADVQFEGLRALARTFDLNAHMARLSAAPAHPVALDDCDEDEEELSEEEREARRKELQRKSTMAALPGLEPAGAFDGYITADGIAVIELRGTLMKFASSFSGGTSTTRARRAIREAVADGRVKAILLVVDSPGGTVAGTPELADEVAAANAKKPVWAYAEDLMASAAYWVSSQCARIGACRTALVGSCGTVMVLYDWSAAFKEYGIEPKVYKTGKRKAAGTTGTEISADDDAYFQSIIDETNTHFKAGVGSGRPKADIEAIFADAGVYLAAQAKSRRLVDEIGPIEQFYNSLVKSVRSSAGPRAQEQLAMRAQTETEPASAEDDAPPATAEADAPPDSVVDISHEGGAMSATTSGSPNPGNAGGPQPVPAASVSQPATITQLKATFPKAGNDFYVAQLEANATLDQARAAYTAKLEADLEAAQGKLAQQAATPAPATVQPAAVTTPAAAPAALPATTAATTPAPAKAGIAPLESKRSDGSTADTSASAELERRAKEIMSGRTNMTLPAAKQKVLAADTDLRERFNAEQIDQRQANENERIKALAVGRR